jgi:hypothetical protein
VACETRIGRRYLVTNLVLGTLKVWFDSEIAPGMPTPLTLEFEPYEVGFQYDYDQSGRKGEERVLDLRGNSKETWAWTVTGREGFEKDVHDLVFYMGYETIANEKAENDVWRQKVEWREKYEAGFFAKIWAWLKSFLNWILAALAVIVTIYANYLTVKVRKLELRLKGAAG